MHVVRKMRPEIALVLLALVSFSAGVSYEGFKVYKVLAKTETENDYLRSLESNVDYDFWSSVNKVGNPVSVMVAPASQQLFEHFLEANQIEFDIQIDNVEATIQAEKAYHRSKQPLKSGRVTFDQYIRHAEINAYLAQLAQSYPDLVTVENIGQSYENRDLNVIRISTRPRNPPKPVIFVDAGIHAREWIAPATALYLINQLVENTAANINLIQDVDWIILPLVNPDGYEYSWDSNRLWRKTVSPGILCNGCDGNRNFGYHWMETGASSYECSETYAGSSAFSEPETRNLAEFINRTDNIAAYLTLHSYGQYLLYPWGYADILADNWQELDSLGRAMDAAISAVRGTRYTVGGSTATLYAAAGASDDWAMGVGGIDIVYTVELPGGGSYGFDLPASQIRNVVVETFEGLKVVGNYVATNRK